MSDEIEECDESYELDFECDEADDENGLKWGKVYRKFRMWNVIG